MSVAEIYFTIFENFRIVYSNEAARSRVEAMLTHAGVEVDAISPLPAIGNSGNRPSVERNGRSAAIPDARFGDDIHGPTQRSGS